jgi:hypothetical protein
MDDEKCEDFFVIIGKYVVVLLVQTVAGKKE